MIAQLLLACAEKHSALTAHGRGHTSKDWGGIPMIVLVGDDYQFTHPFSATATQSFFVKANHIFP